MKKNKNIKIEKWDHRTVEQIKEHYKIEKELADRLRNAPYEERQYLYPAIYDELYQRIPHHPLVVRKSSPEQINMVIYSQMKFLRRFLRKDLIFSEIGAGDCNLSFEVAKFVKLVYAIDVSKVIMDNIVSPANFQLIISNGRDIALPDNSINIVYSNQVIEHLHPDDAFKQLQNIYESLAPGGIHICITSNRLDGPHDISKYFDPIASGLHLKEYSFTELNNLFRLIGFSKVKAYAGLKGIYTRVPLFLLRWYERALEIIPCSLKKIIINLPLFRSLLVIRIVGIK